MLKIIVKFVGYIGTNVGSATNHNNQMIMTRNNILSLATGIALVASLASCHSAARTYIPEGISKNKAEFPIIGSEVQVMPKAIVYQVSGDDAMNLVPVTLSADGKSLVSYPAPSDLNEGQTPINLGDGWWLDRRGIGPNSVFTTYTYDQYEALPQAPSPQELLKHIDRNVRITRMVLLPVSAAEAASDPAVARVYTEGGFKDCTEITLPRH